MLNNLQQQQEDQHAGCSVEGGQVAPDALPAPAGGLLQRPSEGTAPSSASEPCTATTQLPLYPEFSIYRLKLEPVIIQPDPVLFSSVTPCVVPETIASSMQTYAIPANKCMHVCEFPEATGVCVQALVARSKSQMSTSRSRSSQWRSQQHLRSNSGCGCSSGSHVP